MDKVLKKSVFIAVMMLVAIQGVITVSAASKTYKTTISISDNSSLNGTVRDYPNKKYKLTVTPTSLTEGPRSPGEVILATEVRQPKTLFGWEYDYTTKWSGDMVFDANNGVGKEVTITPGDCGSGDRYFYFSTWGGWGAGTGALSGNAVITNYS